MTSPSLLHLMHLVSPALPVGAYAYSQGLEYAIDHQWLKDEAAVEEWIEGLMTNALAKVDLPCFIRCYQAWSKEELVEIAQWNARLRANRETRELQLEDDQLGQALARLLLSLGLPEYKVKAVDNPTFAAMFSLAGVHWHVELDDLLQGFVWSWLENQVAAATKLLPLGQTRAQCLLLRLLPKVEVACKIAHQLDDEDIGFSLPALAMASSRHERQYSRLFRS